MKTPTQIPTTSWQQKLPLPPPGTIAEVSAEEAEQMGAFDEDALSLADALDAVTDDITEDRNHG